MADKRVYYDTSQLTGNELGQAIDSMKTNAVSQRRIFERKWYDNNLFDDGKHFSFLSREQNKIVDLAANATLYNPMRVIPKASRQIRGIVNLLMSRDYIPVVYPERVDKTKYPPIQTQDPQTGEVVEKPNPQLQKALDDARMKAKSEGLWLQQEFDEDNQDLVTKSIHLGILTAKHFVSYLQVMPNIEEETIDTVVRDAFDVFLVGELTELQKSPFVIIAHPTTMAEIKADERFDEEARKEISPDNRHASSEIKEAYMITRYGREYKDDRSASAILNEAFITEYLNTENLATINKQKNAGDIIKDKKIGDKVIRQVYSVGGIVLYDQYVNLSRYPLVDLRFEPGNMYGVAQIERFIPQNKSLDVVVSRIERYTNTMPLGIIAKRQGEQYKITNESGGQVIEYKTVPPRFEQQAPLPTHIFNFIEYLGSVIDEQGVTLSTLNKIPQGVKAAKAIESLKESEFSNLVTADRMLKKFWREVAEIFMEIGDKYFVHTKQVYPNPKDKSGEYFDVIGATALQKRNELNVPLEGDAVTISSKHRVRIEIQAGLGYTREGQKAAAKELGDYMIQLAQIGYINPETISKFLQSLLEAYQFGPTDEFMDEFDDYVSQGQLSDPQMQKIKIAVAEVLKETGMGEKNHDEDIMKAKIGSLEAIKESGLLDQVSPGMGDAKVQQEMQIKDENHQQEMVTADEKQQIEKAKFLQDAKIKQQKAEQDMQQKEVMNDRKMQLAEDKARQAKK